MMFVEIAVSVLMVALFYGILSYMFSKILLVEELEKFAKMELMEVLYSALLILALVGVVQLIDAQTTSIIKEMYASYGIEVPKEVDNLPEMASFRLNKSYELLTNYRRNFFFIVGGTSTKIGWEVGFTDPISYKWGVLHALFENFFNSIIDVMVLIGFLRRLILVFGVLPYILIPAGIVLRAFPPTRGLGALFISFSLAFYIIFPLSYLLLATPEIVESIKVRSPKIPLINVPGIGALGYLIYTQIYMVEITLKTLKDLAFGGELFAMISSILSEICLNPFVAFALALTFTNIASTVFGARIAEIGRGLFRLM